MSTEIRRVSQTSIPQAAPLATVGSRRLVGAEDGAAYRLVLASKCRRLQLGVVGMIRLGDGSPTAPAAAQDGLTTGLSFQNWYRTDTHTVLALLTE